MLRVPDLTEDYSANDEAAGLPISRSDPPVQYTTMIGILLKYNNEDTPMTEETVYDVDPTNRIGDWVRDMQNPSSGRAVRENSSAIPRGSTVLVLPVGGTLADAEPLGVRIQLTDTFAHYPTYFPPATGPNQFADYKEDLKQLRKQNQMRQVVNMKLRARQSMHAMQVEEWNRNNRVGPEPQFQPPPPPKAEEQALLDRVIQPRVPQVATLVVFLPNSSTDLSYMLRAQTAANGSVSIPLNDFADTSDDTDNRFMSTSEGSSLAAIDLENVFFVEREVEGRIVRTPVERVFIQKFFAPGRTGAWSWPWGAPIDYAGQQHMRAWMNSNASKQSPAIYTLPGISPDGRLESALGSLLGDFVAGRSWARRDNALQALQNGADASLAVRGTTQRRIISALLGAILYNDSALADAVGAAEIARSEAVNEAYVYLSEAHRLGVEVEQRVGDGILVALNRGARVDLNRAVTSATQENVDMDYIDFLSRLGERVRAVINRRDDRGQREQEDRRDGAVQPPPRDFERRTYPNSTPELESDLLDAMEEDEVGELIAVLERGANPNVYTDEDTLLIRAIVTTDYDFLRELLRFGADPNLRTSDGILPLAIAIHYLEPDVYRIAQLLLLAGADPFTRNSNGNLLTDSMRSGEMRTLVQMWQQMPTTEREQRVAQWRAENLRVPPAQPATQPATQQPAQQPAQASRFPRHDPQRQAAFIAAAAAGDLVQVNAFLLAGQDPDIEAEEDGDAMVGALINEGVEYSEATPLMAAALHGNKNVCERLLEVGAVPDPVDEGNSPLSNAAFQGHVDIVLLLLRYGAGDGTRFPASDEDDFPNKQRVFDALYDWGTLGEDGRRRACYEARRARTYPKHNEEKAVDLIDAVRNNVIADVQKLIIDGVNPSEYNVDQLTGEYEPPAWGCVNPLMLSLLLQAGADPDATDNEGTPILHRAIEKSAPVAVIQALLQVGAGTETRDSQGRTPLHRAAAFNNYAAADLLLLYGADVEAKENYGRTPLHVAVPLSGPVARLLLVNDANYFAADDTRYTVTDGPGVTSQAARDWRQMTEKQRAAARRLNAYDQARRRRVIPYVLRYVTEGELQDVFSYTQGEYAPDITAMTNSELRNRLTAGLLINVPGHPVLVFDNNMNVARLKDLIAAGANPFLQLYDHPYNLINPALRNLALEYVPRFAALGAYRSGQRYVPTGTNQQDFDDFDAQMDLGNDFYAVSAEGLLDTAYAVRKDMLHRPQLPLVGEFPFSVINRAIDEGDYATFRKQVPFMFGVGGLLVAGRFVLIRAIYRNEPLMVHDLLEFGFPADGVELAEADGRVPLRHAIDKPMITWMLLNAGAMHDGLTSTDFQRMDMKVKKMLLQRDYYYYFYFEDVSAEDLAVMGENYGNRGEADIKARKKVGPDWVQVTDSVQRDVVQRGGNVWKQWFRDGRDVGAGAMRQLAVSGDVSEKMAREVFVAANMYDRSLVSKFLFRVLDHPTNTIDSVELWLRAGADPNRRVNDEVRIVAGMQNFVNKVKLLADYGLNPNLPYDGGTLPLHVVIYEATEVTKVMAMVDAGANPLLRSLGQRASANARNGGIRGYLRGMETVTEERQAATQAALQALQAPAQPQAPQQPAQPPAPQQPAQPPAQPQAAQPPAQPPAVGPAAPPDPFTLTIVEAVFDIAFTLTFEEIRNLRDGQGQTVLFAATTSNNPPDAVDGLLRVGVNPNLVDSSGRTPLMQARERLTARSLLRHGADPNAVDENFNTPLYYAAVGNYTEVVEELLNHYAIGNWRAGFSSVSLQQSLSIPEPIKQLIRSKSAPNWSGEFQDDQRDIVENVYDRNYDLVFDDANDAFASKMQENDVPFGFRLLKLAKNNGVTISASAGTRNDPPLVHAARTGNVPFVKMLIAAGYDVNERSPAPERFTPLHAAAAEGHAMVYIYLALSGANVRLEANNKTPFAIALERNHGLLTRLRSHLLVGARQNKQIFKDRWTWERQIIADALE